MTNEITIAYRDKRYNKTRYLIAFGIVKPSEDEAKKMIAEDSPQGGDLLWIKSAEEIRIERLTKRKIR
jgi:hypothetical protein